VHIYGQKSEEVQVLCPEVVKTPRRSTLKEEIDKKRQEENG
jgi:hypothetical protein